MVDEILRENVACALFLDSKDLNRGILRFSSDPPHTFANDRVLEEVEELACEVDANVTIPFVRALLLDPGWDLLCVHLFDIEQFAVS
jgi:hypothetical protein